MTKIAPNGFSFLFGGEVSIKVYHADGRLKSDYKQPVDSLVHNAISFLYAMITNTSAVLKDLANSNINLAWGEVNASTLNWVECIGWGDVDTAYDYDDYGLAGSREFIRSLSITAFNESGQAGDMSITAGFTITASRQCKEIVLGGLCGTTSSKTFAVAREVLGTPQAVDVGDTLAVTFKPLLEAT